MQLSHLLLRWSCNARDVHLLRGLPARVVNEAARLHDRSIMVACAAIQGCATLPSRPDSDYTGDPSDLHAPGPVQSAPPLRHHFAHQLW